MLGVLHHHLTLETDHIVHWIAGVVGHLLCRRGYPTEQGQSRPIKQTAANSPLRPRPRSDQSIMIGVSPRSRAAWQMSANNAVCTATVSKACWTGNGTDVLALMR